VTGVVAANRESGAAAGSRSNLEPWAKISGRMQPKPCLCSFRAVGRPFWVWSIVVLQLLQRRRRRSCDGIMRDFSPWHHMKQICPFDFLFLAMSEE
jgi:hypothetical protein